MRRIFRITIVAAVLMAVAAWASPANAEPWGGYHPGYYRDYRHHGAPKVYLRPGYPAYGPLVVVSGAYPSYFQPRQPVDVKEVRLVVVSGAYPSYFQPRHPVGVREVRLHDEEGSANSLTTKGHVSTNNGQRDIPVRVREVRLHDN
jgi:hypothetical protein